MQALNTKRNEKLPQQLTVNFFFYNQNGINGNTRDTPTLTSVYHQLTVKVWLQHLVSKFA